MHNYTLSNEQVGGGESLFSRALIFRTAIPNSGSIYFECALQSRRMRPVLLCATRATLARSSCAILIRIKRSRELAKRFCYLRKLLQICKVRFRTAGRFISSVHFNVAGCGPFFCVPLEQPSRAARVSFCFVSRGRGSMPNGSDTCGTYYKSAKYDSEHSGSISFECALQFRRMRPVLLCPTRATLAQRSCVIFLRIYRSRELAKRDLCLKHRFTGMCVKHRFT